MRMGNPGLTVDQELSFKDEGSTNERMKSDTRTWFKSGTLGPASVYSRGLSRLYCDLLVSKVCGLP